jgi:hypothetical protein
MQTNLSLVFNQIVFRLFELFDWLKQFIKRYLIFEVILIKYNYQIFITNNTINYAKSFDLFLKIKTENKIKIQSPFNNSLTKLQVFMINELIYDVNRYLYRHLRTKWQFFAKHVTWISYYLWVVYLGLN